MLIIGLTGGIAAGKTTISNILLENNIPIFDADKIVHKLQKEGEIPFLKIKELFPDVIEKGQVNRALLRKKIIKDKAILPMLEAIIHPYVKQEREEFLKREKLNNAPFCVLDVPLLYEIGLDKECDLNLLVETSLPIRQERLKQRGLNREEIEKLLKRQMSDEEKRKRSDIIIDTSGPPLETKRKLERLLRFLKIKI